MGYNFLIMLVNTGICFYYLSKQYACFYALVNYEVE